MAKVIWGQRPTPAPEGTHIDDGPSRRRMLKTLGLAVGAGVLVAAALVTVIAR